jgi:hypothetical protein
MYLPSFESSRTAASDLFAVAACKLEDTLNPLTHTTDVRLRAELELLLPPRLTRRADTFLLLGREVTGMQVSHTSRTRMHWGCPK